MKVCDNCQIELYNDDIMYCEKCNRRLRRVTEEEKQFREEVHYKEQRLRYPQYYKNVPQTNNQINKQNNQPKCPLCQSPNIQQISLVKRGVSGVMFGLFSKTARSQWECKNCGNKF